MLTCTYEENEQSEDQTLDRNTGECPEESQVKIPVITSVVSVANSELQQLSSVDKAPETGHR